MIAFGYFMLGVLAGIAVTILTDALYWVIRGGDDDDC